MATITLTTDVNNHITAASGTSISYLQDENLIRDTSTSPTDFSGNINVSDMILTTQRWSNLGSNNITINGGVSVFSAGATGLGGASNSIGSGATNIDGHDFINAGTGDASFGAFATGTGTIQNTNFINTSGTGWFLGFATWLGTFSNISLDGFLDSHASLATVVDGFTYSGRARGANRTQASNDRNQGYTARVLMNGLSQDHMTVHNNVFPNQNNAYSDTRASQVTCTINDADNRIYLVNNRYEDQSGQTANTFKVGAFGQGTFGTCEWIETYTWRPVFLDAADIAIGTTTVIEDVRIIGLPALTRIFRDTQSSTEYALSDAIATNVNPHSGSGRLTYLMQVGDAQEVTASNGQRATTEVMTKGLAFNLDGTTSVISPTSVTTKSYTHLIDEPTRMSEVNIPVYSGGATGTYNFTADEDISNYATDANLNGRTQTQALALTALADITDAYPALKAHWYTTDTSRFAFTPTITGGLLNPGTGKSINFSRTGATDYASTGLRIQATTIGIGNVTGVTGATTTDYDTLTPPSGFTMGVGAHANFGNSLDGVNVALESTGTGLVDVGTFTLIAASTLSRITFSVPAGAPTFPNAASTYSFQQGGITYTATNIIEPGNGVAAIDFTPSFASIMPSGGTVTVQEGGTSSTTSVLTLATGSTTISDLNFGTGFTTNANRASVFADNTSSAAKTISIPAGDTWLSEHSGLQALIEARNYTVVQVAVVVQRTTSVVIPAGSSGTIVQRDLTTNSNETVTITNGVASAPFSTIASNSTSSFRYYYKLNSTPGGATYGIRVQDVPTGTDNITVEPLVINSVFVENAATDPNRSFTFSSSTGNDIIGRFSSTSGGAAASRPSSQAAVITAANSSNYFNWIVFHELEQDLIDYGILSATMNIPDANGQATTSNRIVLISNVNTGQTNLNNVSGFVTQDTGGTTESTGAGVPQVQNIPLGNLDQATAIGALSAVLNTNQRLQYIAGGDVSVFPRGETEAEYITRIS